MFGEIVGLIPAILWAISPLFYKRGLRNLNPVFGNTIRALPATLLTFTMSFLLLGFDEVLHFSPQALFASVLSGSIGLGLGDLFYLISIKQIGAARAVTITSSYPLITLFMSYLLLGEKVDWYIGIGTLLVVLGIALISFNEADSKIGFRGIVVALLAAFFWSVSILLAGILPSEGHPIAVNSWRLIGLTVFSLVPFFFAYRSNGVPTLDKGSLGYLTFGGLVGLSLGWIAFIYSIGLIGLSKATTLSSVSPVFTAVGEFIMERRFKGRIMLGSTLTTLGIILVTL
ncbi:MAG: DMT family transporter [Nitrososphaeria archaeon]